MCTSDGRLAFSELSSFEIIEFLFYLFAGGHRAKAISFEFQLPAKFEISPSLLRHKHLVLHLNVFGTKLIERGSFENMFCSFPYLLL
jgi:hypothetical protein